LPPEKFVPEIRRIERGERTLKSLKKAVAANPRDLAAALDLAEKLVEADAPAAERVLRAVPADVQPADAAQAVRRALLLAQALERQADLSGDDPAALNNLAWQAFQYRHERTFAKLLPKAIEWARKSVKLSGEEADALDTLANLLAATGEIDEAITLEEKAAAK